MWITGVRVQDGYRQLCKIVGDTFGRRLLDIADLCLDIKKVVDEDMISGEFHTMVVSCGASFNSREMDESYTSQKATDAQAAGGTKVVCMTEMGLRKIDKKGSDRRSVTLLKPKVVLEAVLKELPGARNASRV